MANQPNEKTTEQGPDPKLPGINDEPVTNADEGANTEISDEELALLDSTEQDQESDNLSKATLDKTDEDGEVLNEFTDLSGNDLDVPGSEYDDENEIIGAEDEENNVYSQGADKEDGAQPL